MTVKLRKFRTAGFRGARFDLVVDFGKANRSFAIFGENATGKSTITDAIEWFLKGRIEHLWKEDCKESALRNVMIGSDQSGDVEIHFSQKGLNSIKCIESDLTIHHSNNSEGFKQVIEKIANERVILRHADIAAFVLKTKTSKRDEIESIIGFDAIRKFREVIRISRTKLESEQDYISARARKESAEERILSTVGELISTYPALLEKINKILAPFEIKTVVKDEASLSEALNKLKSSIGDTKRTEKKIALDKLAVDATTIESLIEKVEKSRKKYEQTYSSLFSDKEEIYKIKLESFLSLGLDVLKEEVLSDIGCPFCLTQQDQEKLRQAVEKRISDIAGLKEKFDNARNAKGELISALTELKRHFEAMILEHKDLEPAKDFLADTQLWSTTITSECEEIEKSFSSLGESTFKGEIWQCLADITKKSSECAKESGEASKDLVFSEHEIKAIEAHEKIGILKSAFIERLINGKIVDLYETQILSLGAIHDKFIDAQNSAMQQALDAISHDVAEFYRELHPNENIDDVRLRIVGEQGVEFEYSFHGQPVYPPRKYLSESHLNSLGIVLFLSSAKLLNEHSRFLILDDIVTSFDIGHRRRLLRLLEKHFSDWQIVILTHELFWFEMIKKELGPNGWLFEEANFDDDNGITLSASATNLRALIDVKRKNHDVSNDLRKLLEAQLKEICNELDVRVPFRFNDLNERRTPDELLSDLEGTINKRKCQQVKDHNIFPKLKASNLVSNIGSHDNVEQISGGDIDVALEDIDTLVGMFTCKECKRLVNAKLNVPGKKVISCKCGKLMLDWAK